MNRVAVAVGVGILGLAAWLMVRNHNSSLMDRIEEIDAGRPKWKEKEVRALMEKAETSWAEAAAALDRGDLDASFFAYRDALHPLHTYVLHYGENEVEPGLTLAAWFDRRDSDYREKIAPAFDRLIARLETGDFPYPDFKQIITNFSTVEIDLKSPFEAVKQRVADARARASADWLRVVIMKNGIDGPYEAAVRGALADRWSADAGKKLVFGFEIDRPEKLATWKTLEVRIDEQYARYFIESESLRRRSSRPFPEIPSDVKIAFKLDGTAVHPTSWDALAEIRAEADTPETLWMELKDSGKLDEAEKRAIENRKNLAAAVEKALARLPRFEVFPGVAAAGLSVGRPDAIDLDAARALAYRDRPRLERELADLARQAPPDSRADLARLIVELDVDSLAPWVAEVLPAFDAAPRREVLIELEKRPWFGGYEPILAVVASAAETEGRALQALHGHMHLAELRQAVLRKIDDRSFARRSDYLMFLVREAPLETTRPFAERWVTDEDPNFAAAAFTGFMNAGMDATEELTLPYFDRAPERAQVWMLNYFRFDPEKHGERGLEILAESALNQSAPRELRANAYRALEAASRATLGWDALDAVDRSETDPERRAQSRRVLLQNVQYAKPKIAIDYYRRAASEGDSVERNMAIHGLLGGDGPKEEAIHFLAGLVSERGSDAELVAQVIRAIAQYHRLRRNWNFGEDQVELHLLLLSGTNHPDPRVRRADYEVMGYALQQGNDHYVNLLRNALLGEKDPELRRLLEGYLSVPAPARR